MKFAQVRGNFAPVQPIVQEYLHGEGYILLNGKLLRDFGDENIQARDVYPEFKDWVENRANDRDDRKKQIDKAYELVEGALKPHREAWMLMAGFRQDRSGYDDSFTGINWYRIRQEYYARKACRQALRDYLKPDGTRWDDVFQEEVPTYSIDIPVGGMVLGAGVRTYDEAVRFIEIWSGLCSRPGTFGSPYNPDPKNVMDWIRACWCLPNWVTAVMARMGQKTHYPIERLGNHHVLFEAAKAWKLNILFWKDVAVRIGRLPLWKRMVASEVLNTLASETGVTFHHGSPDLYSEEWKTWQTDRSLRIEFWVRFNNAVKPGMTGALATHIRHSKGNVKRVVNLLHGKTLDENQCALLATEAKAPAMVGFKAAQWVKALTHVQADSHLGDWQVQGCIGLVAVFGKQWQRWLDKQASLNRGLHDAIYWLPTSFSPLRLQGLDGFLFKHGEQPIEELEVISKNWAALKEEERKLSYAKLLGLCRSRKYEGVESEAFASEAAKWGTSDSEYNRFERVYLQSLKVSTPFDPAMQWEEGGYVGRFLPRQDPRVGFFGNYTNCCQHWTGVGKACAISTVSDSFSQLFVIEKDGEIIAGSWVWEAINHFGDKAFRVACFDNVEAKGLSGNQHNIFAEIYQQVGNWLCAQGGYRKVTIGTGLSDLDLSYWNATSNLTLPSQYSGYTDAGSQVLVAENPTAPALRKNQEKVWVRGALEADLEASQHVAEACYPDGWQTVSMPDGDDPRGMVLMHQTAGIIGYAVWDAATRYISDVAVLPNFRRQAPHFIDSLFEQCNDGEWWKGEFRASTSYRSIQRYAQRGRIEFQDKGISHYVGEDACDACHEITFRVL